MILADLLQHINCLENYGTTGIEVTRIQFDSRKVTQGTVFVATRGTATDGHDLSAWQLKTAPQLLYANQCLKN